MGHFRLELPKFSFEKIVSAKRDIVYRVFSNYDHYQEMLPQHFPSVRIRSVRGNTAVVEEHFNLGSWELLIMAKHVTKEPILHEVFVIGGDAKGSYIKQQFVKLSEGTKILVDVDVRLKGRMKLLDMFGKNDLKEKYAVIVEDFAKIVEN